MYQRVDSSIHVQPWTFPEFKEMALDQGWDRNPNRLLTLWTAYNGLPGHWRRFWTNPTLSDFSRISDDVKWTRQFLAFEGTYRQTRDGAFHRQMEIELRASDHAIVRWLAEKPEGWNLATDLHAPTNRAAVHAIKTALQNESPDAALSDSTNVHTYVQDAINRRLSGAHLGLLCSRAPLDSENRIKWSVADNFARFQLQGLEPFETVRTAEIAQKNQAKTLTNLEGSSLEAFSADSLRHLFDVGADHLLEGQMGRCDIRHRVERKNMAGDVDVLVIHHQEGPNPDRIHDGPRDFWIGSVKRRAQTFLRIKSNRTDTDVARDIQRVQEVLKPLTVGPSDLIEDFKTEWRHAVHFVVITRSFTNTELQAIAQEIADVFAEYPCHGIDQVYSMDIADVISGRGPQPLPLPEPTQEIIPKKTKVTTEPTS